MKTMLLCALLVGCGHKKAGPDMPAPDETGEHADPTPDPSASMIPPEKQDEITQALKRKGNTLSRCLSEAIENGDVKKSTHGKISFEVVVGTSGSATSVKVIKSDIDNQGILDCATKKLQETSFPAIPKPYETSMTYTLETS